jgi:uncharacterized delta-60 repeat protein
MDGVFKVRLGAFTAALAVGSLLFASASSAAPGGLDGTFGSGGMATSSLEGESAANDVAIQSDGKIVVVGNVGGCSGSGESYSCHSEFLVERLNDDGTPDADFGGGDGAVTTSFGHSSQGATSVVIEPSGKIVVGGGTFEAGEETGEFAVARYEVNGDLDTTFGGGDGKATIAMPGTSGGPSSYSGSMVLQPDGKIVLDGSVYAELPGDPWAVWHFALARFNADGTPDDSFGSGGSTIGPSGNEFGLTEEPGGKLLAAGRAGFSEFAVLRFNANGSLDTGFAGDGIATYNLSQVGSQADDVLVQPDGKILASGYGNGYAVGRFNSDGTPDTTFGGGDGVVTTHFGQPCCGLGAAIALALQGDGRIVFAGQWTPDEDTFVDQWAVGRLSANGRPDPSFGADGLAVTDPAGNTTPVAVAIQGDGKIVAAGASGEQSKLTVARYLGGGAASTATFHHVLVTKGGSGKGFVGGPELSCGGNCGADYEAGETIELGAYGEYGESVFDGWHTVSGAPGTCTGMTTPCEVTLSADVELEANFRYEPTVEPVLTVGKTGSGQGLVYSTPLSGIFCGLECSRAFESGTKVTLVAAPYAGSTFAGWSGGGCSGTGSCEVTLNADTTVTASFGPESTGGEEVGDGGGSGGGAGEVPLITPPAAGSLPLVSPHPSTTPANTKKPPKCRKGFSKRKVRGKSKCVKAKSHRHKAGSRTKGA